MNNYISAGLMISKFLGVTILVAIGVAALMFVLIAIFLIVRENFRRVREMRRKEAAEKKLIEAEKQLGEAIAKLKASGAFMDIWNKQGVSEPNEKDS